MRIPVYERQAGIAPLSIPQEQPKPQIDDNGEGVSKTLAGVFDRLQKINDGIDDARTLELFNKFKMDTQDYHENPHDGIYRTRVGFQSKGVFSDADRWMREKGEDYVRQLPSERAKANFRKMAQEHIQQRGLQNSKFEAEQVKRYEQEQADAAIKNSLIYIEHNWNNKQAVDQARRDIQQALELKMRGSGQDAFTNAWAEIEDQIGTARIRQAFVQHPLRALEELRNPDIHLKPETFAKLKKSLTDQTEIYELQAIASSFAQRFTSNDAVNAHNLLLQTYDPDKAEKAFSALSHIWSIGEYQLNSRKRDEQEAQQRHEEALLSRFNDHDATPPTVQEIIDSQKKHAISPRFAMQALGIIQQRETKAAEEAKAQIKAVQERNDFILWSMEHRGEFLSDERLEEYIVSEAIEQSRADKHIARRKEYARQQEQEEKKRLEQNMQDFLTKFLDGSLTENEINEARTNNVLNPDDALTLRNYLRSENDRKIREAEQLTARNEKELKQSQEEYEDMLRILINNGGIISHKTATTLFTERKISRSFLQTLYNHEDEYMDKQERLRKEQEREKAAQAKAQAAEQAKADKEQHEEELDHRAQQFADMAWDDWGGSKGAMLDEIAKLDLPLEDRKLLAERADNYFTIKERQKKDTQSLIKHGRENAYNDTWFYVMTEVNTQEEITNARNDFIIQKRLGSIDEHMYNELIGILDKKEKALQNNEKVVRQRKNYEIARDYASKFSLDNADTPYEEIRSTYTKEDADDIIRNYDRLIQEQQTIRSKQEKAVALQQEKTFTDLLNNNWRKGLTVDIATIQQLKASGSISEQQAERAYSLNTGLSTKIGMERTLSQHIENWGSLSPTEKEAQVMLAMGTNQEQRKENFSYLYQKAINDTLTNAEIEHYRAYGMITDSDAENLREYPSKFERQQKERLNAASTQLKQVIRDMVKGSKDGNTIITMASTQFALAVSNIDTHAKNFDEIVQQIFDGVIQSATDAFGSGKSLTQRNLFSWPPFQSVPTPAGQRIDNARQTGENYRLPQVETRIPFTDAQGNVQWFTPQGDTQPFDNSIPVSPVQDRPPQKNSEPPFWKGVADWLVDWWSNPPDNSVGIPPADVPIPNPTRIYSMPSGNVPAGVVDTVKSIAGEKYVVTSEFSAKPTKLRNGRGHLSIDISMPEGTNVPVPNVGIGWTVSGTGENSKAGKFVKIRALIGEDVYEYTFGHLSSIGVAKGDRLAPAAVVGKSGNTGNSTAPHLHINLKKNGKPIDPRKVDFGVNAPQLPASQPILPPTVSSDEEQLQMAEEILRGALGLGNPSFRGKDVIPDNIFTTIPYGGY